MLKIYKGFKCFDRISRDIGEILKFELLEVGI